MVRGRERSVWCDYAVLVGVGLAQPQEDTVGRVVARHEDRHEPGLLLLPPEPHEAPNPPPTKARVISRHAVR